MILVVVYLVFGPKKIPELARMLGKGINEMRRATSEIKNEISREMSGVKKDLNVDLDLKDPLGIKKTVEDTINPITSKPPHPVNHQEKEKSENTDKGGADSKVKEKTVPKPDAGIKQKKKKPSTKKES